MTVDDDAAPAVRRQSPPMVFVAGAAVGLLCRGIMATVKVELFYFDGCPNWRLAEERLREALAAAGLAPLEIYHRTVETKAEAEALHFPGSPTILIDGLDPFPSPPQTHGLSCRMYATPAGLAGAPTVEQLVQALTNAR
ncbi:MULTISPECIES: DF family (seleno)protein [Saccharomonospora]|jgi:hypothetical protein|uniref:Alkylmercury lyase n=3 Tax=Saccharomonospora TaxID=1851 RepID=H5XFX5_9PSEU|nr:MULTISPECIES: hypothetical protein [Saccharomonospora]EHR61531.1 hypothetical protein SaccyDRAFT_2680 [Saccharomonospora cyanea NA-134]